VPSSGTHGVGNVPLRRFLLAYFLYFDGVETDDRILGIFAATTLKFTTPKVIKLFLAVQFSALAGALLLARPTDRWGAKRVNHADAAAVGRGVDRRVLRADEVDVLRGGGHGRLGSAPFRRRAAR